MVGMAAMVLLWSAVSARAGRANVTAPIAFLLMGMVMGSFDALPIVGDSGSLLLISELTLAMILFHDAATVRLSDLRRDWQIPLRLLAIAFPLTVAVMAASAYWLIPSLGVAGAILVGAAVAPTDAGLGAPTVLNPSVPVRVRRALNVESGLNDGLATPIVLAALAVLSSDLNGGGESAGLIISGLAIPLGMLAGAVIGVGGAMLLDRSRLAGSSTTRSRSLGVLAVPFLAYGAAELIGANAFIAAFVAGLAFSRVAKCIVEEPDVNLAAEDAADLLGYLVWFLAGLVGIQGTNLLSDWRWWVLAVLALTLARMVPVWLALLGMHLRLPTVLFIGWFGPRGLATVVFALLTLETLGESHPIMGDIGGILGLTVLLSVILHGITAGPLVQRYTQWVSANQTEIENEPSPEPMPSRGRHAHLRKQARKP